MENSFVGAPPDMAVFDQILAEEPGSSLHLRKPFADNSFFVPDTLEDLLEFDLKSYDFEMLNSLPPPPPPSTAAFVPVDSVSSVESNARASRPGPVGPIAGLDRGKSVVGGVLGGIGIGMGGAGSVGGGGRKEKRRRNTVTVETCGPAVCLGKRAMDSEQLAELARVDPKRVKRILANRQSAAKSKERRVQHEKDLTERVPQLAIEATNVTTNVSMLQRDITTRKVRIKELRITREAMRQEARIKNALDAAVKEEVRSLTNETGNIDIVLNYPSLEELFSQFSSQLSLHQFHNPPSQQQHLGAQQTQLSMPNPLPPSTHQSFSGHYGLNFSNFNNQN